MLLETGQVKSKIGVDDNLFEYLWYSLDEVCSQIAENIASKKAGQPYGLHEIAHATNVSSKKVFKCCKFVPSQLSLSYNTETVEAYIHRVCGLLGVNKRTAEVINKIMQATSQDGCSNGKSLPGLVSASTYIVSILMGEHRTQREIAEATRVTEATIRMRYKSIIKKLLFVLSV